jgi:hypothetical protein
MGGVRQSWTAEFSLTISTLQASTIPSKDTSYIRNGADPITSSAVRIPIPFGSISTLKPTDLVQGAEASVEPDAAHPVQDGDCCLTLIYSSESFDT